MIPKIENMAKNTTLVPNKSSKYLPKIIPPRIGTVMEIPICETSTRFSSIFDLSFTFNFITPRIFFNSINLQFIWIHINFSP